jgi:hypothetical protein
MRPAIVLDINVLRHEPFIKTCIEQFRSSGEQIVLPEMVLFEVTKHPQKWEYTLTRSFRPLAACPEAVVVSHSAKTLGLLEEETGKPTQSVENPMMTEALRKILSDLRDGDGPDLDFFRWAVPRARELLGHEKHAEDSRKMMQTLKTIAKSTFPREDIARVGNDLATGRASETC